MGFGSFHSSLRANTVLVVVMLVALGTGLIVSFLDQSNNDKKTSSMLYDYMDAAYTMETALAEAEAQMARAIDGINLNGKLQFAGGPASENFTGLSNAYVDPGGDIDNGKALAMEFFREAVVAQAYSSTGDLDSSNEFSNFDSAFPSTFTDPDPTDDSFYEVKYEFYPLPTRMTTSPATITFEYEYVISIRAYGRSDFSGAESKLTGIISIPLQNAPFSRWAAILNELRNQNGSTLVFAGGNTSAQFQQVFNGPVHVNAAGHFYGHPVFNMEFSSGKAFSQWRFWNNSNYSGCWEKYGGSKEKCFRGGYTESADIVTYPTDIFNTLRLAAGDTSATAATDTTAPTEAELISMVQENFTGTLGSISTLPDGVYIPLDDQSSKTPQGGIYVRGDAHVQLNVVTDPSTDMNSDYYNNLPNEQRWCEFQQIQVENLSTGEVRDVFVGSDLRSGAPDIGTFSSSDPCDVSYVYDNSSTTDAPVALSSRIGGNVYIEGNIDELGSVSRTRPSIAQDFGYHITATKDIRILNDLQYQDAEYYNLDSDGAITGSQVADPFGEVNGSGVVPTDERLGVAIDEDSKTILGISSLYRNIKVHASAPSNLNLHMALYAGNSDAYDSSTGHGCNADTAAKRGCGWGVENWNTKTGAGTMKIFGSTAEYKNQTTGMISGAKKYGYDSLFFYDNRLLEELQPPGFPISNEINAYPTVTRFKAWRLSRAD